MLLYVLVTMFLTLSSQVWGWDYDPTPSNLNDPTPPTLNDQVYFVIGPLPQLRGQSLTLIRDGVKKGDRSPEYFQNPNSVSTSTQPQLNSTELVLTQK